eukprot:g6093.t1
MSATARSSGSGRYRRVGSGRDVDESLFGSSPAKSAGKTIVTGDTLRQLRNTNAAFVSTTELGRIRDSTRIVTGEMVRMQQERQEQERAVKLKVARDRKARMARKAAEAAKRREKSDIELAQEAERIALLDKAGTQRDEQMDGVKMLQTLGARAAAFTIRDQQLKELEERRKRDRLYDERMDREMEIERLRDLQRREVVEQQKADQRLQDREVLMQQIEERKVQRLRQEEQVLLEQAAMVEQIKQNQEIDAAKVREKAEIAARTVAEVEVFNKRALALRERQREMERLEDEKVLVYQAMKAEKEKQREIEEAERKQALEDQTIRLRKQQEKMADNRSAMDELRARRHAEEHERRARNAEMAEAQKRARDARELKRARDQQARFKELQRAQEVSRQKHEYNVILKQAADAQAREDAEDQERHFLRTDHATKLNKQIADNANRRKTGMTDTREEGRQIAMDFAVERAKLERIRQEYVARLEKEGVNPRYLSEMKRCDMAKLQMR